MWGNIFRILEGMKYFPDFSYSILAYHMDCFLFVNILWSETKSSRQWTTDSSDHYCLLPVLAKKKIIAGKIMREIRLLAEALKMKSAYGATLKGINKVSRPKIRSEVFYSTKDHEVGGSSFHNSWHAFLISALIDLRCYLNHACPLALCTDLSGSLHKHWVTKRLSLCLCHCLCAGSPFLSLDDLL